MKIAAILLLVLPIVAFAAVLPRNYNAEPNTDLPPHTTDDDSSLWDQLKKEYEKIKDEIKHELDAAKEELGKVETEIKDKIHQAVGSLHDTLEKIKEEIKEKNRRSKKRLGPPQRIRSSQIRRTQSQS